MDLYEEKPQRKIKGIWIPIEIWQDSHLSWNEKILLMEIDSCTTEVEDCCFSNKYIAELLGVNETFANKLLSSLISKKYVIKTKFDGRRRFVRSNIRISTNEENNQGCTKVQGCLAAECKPPIYIDNNKNDNNIINKDNKEKIEDKSSKKEDIATFVDKVYAMYPTKCPIRGVYLGKTLKDKDRIKSLLKKYSQEDILRVMQYEIDNAYGKYRMKNFSTFLNNFPDPQALFANDLFSTNTTQQQCNVENEKEMVINGQTYR